METHIQLGWEHVAHLSHLGRHIHVDDAKWMFHLQVDHLQVVSRFTPKHLSHFTPHPHFGKQEVF